jgi:hypothetical protein
MTTERQKLAEAMDNCGPRFGYGGYLRIVFDAARKHLDSLPPDPVERTIVQWHVEVFYNNDDMSIYAYPTREGAQGRLARLRELAEPNCRGGRVTGPHEHKVPL